VSGLFVAIMVILFNNHEYKSMKRNHLELHPRGIAKQTGIHFGSKVDTFDYAGLATLFEGFGKTVNDAAELKQMLGEALEAMPRQIGGVERRDVAIEQVPRVAGI
jgi:acetolactate synthase-1/2/3 large subunit